MAITYSRLAHPALPYALLALGLVALLLPFWLLHPLLLDQYIYMYVAKVIVAGGAPYLDAWEQKGPLLHLIYAALIALGPAPETALKLFDTAALLGALILLYRIGQRHGGPITGWIAVSLALLFTPLTAVSLMQADSWSACLGIAMLALLLREPSSHKRSYFLAGLLQGACLMLKPTTALLALMAIRGTIRHDRLRTRLHLLALYGAGSLVAPSLILLWLAQHQALGAFWHDYILFNLFTHSSASPATVTQALFLEPMSWPYVMPALRMLYLPIAGLGWWLWRQKDRLTVDMVGLISLAFLIAYEGQALYSINHAVAVYLPASLLAAQVVSRYPLMLLLSLLQIPVLLGQPGLAAAESWRYLLGLINRETYLENYSYANHNPNQLERITQRVNAISPAHSPIYIYGFQVTPYILSNRLAPTRYFFNYPLTKGSEAQIATVRQILLRDLKANPPQLILIPADDTSNLQQMSSRQLLTSSGWFLPFIQSAYTLIEEPEGWQIYTRNKKPPGE